MSISDGDVNIPEELVDKLLNFHQDFEKMAEILKPLTTLNINSTDNQIEPLDRAQLNLVCGFALNSLFKMYLNTVGSNFTEFNIKEALDRYKSLNALIKQTADKAKAPTLNKDAAKRFVRNALWAPREPEVEDAASSSIEEEENIRGKRERDPSPSRQRFGKLKKQKH